MTYVWLFRNQSQGFYFQSYKFPRHIRTRLFKLFGFFLSNREMLRKEKKRRKKIKYQVHAEYCTKEKILYVFCTPRNLRKSFTINRIHFKRDKQVENLIGVSRNFHSPWLYAVVFPKLSRSYNVFAELINPIFSLLICNLAHYYKWKFSELLRVQQCSKFLWKK